MRDTLKIAVIVGALLMIAAGTSQLIVTDSTLTGNGSTANPLRVVTSVMQSRVTGTCTSPNAIDVINSDGTVTCSTGVLNTSNVSCATAGALARYTSGNVLQCSSLVDNALSTVRDPKTSGAAVMDIGDDTSLATNAQNGYTITAYSDGNNYIDSKTYNGGHTYYRMGAGAFAGFAGTYETVNNNSAAVEWAGAQTMDQTLEVVGSATFDANTNTLAGGASNQYIYTLADEIDFYGQTNATATGFINYHGYQGGTTQYRDLSIRDGKTGEIAHFTGSTKGLELFGSEQIDGTVGIGIAPSSTPLTINTPANNDGLLLWNTQTGQTLDRNGVDSRVTGSFDTTSALLQPAAFGALVTSTRSAGSNPLVNTGYYANVSGGQQNYAYYAVAGDLYEAATTLLNVASGVTQITGHGDTTGDLQVADSTTISGAGTVSNVVWVTRTGQSTRSNTLGTPTWNDGVHSSVSSTAGGTCAGAGEGGSPTENGCGVDNRAIYGNATGGDFAYSGYFDNGKFRVNGPSTFNSSVTLSSTANLIVGGVITTSPNGVLVLDANGLGDTELDDAVRALSTVTVTGLTTATGGITSTAATNTVGNLTESFETFSNGTGAVNNVAISATKTGVLWTCGAPTTITGLAAPSGGAAQVYTIVVVSGQCKLANENAGSTAGNRLHVGGASLDFTLNPGDAVTLVYDPTATRWRPILQESFARLLVMNGVAGVYSVDTAGHIHTTGTAPTLSSCGTTPTVTGGDSGFVVTTGTGATACTITFAVAYTTNAPACQVTPDGGAALPAITRSTTALTFGTGTAASTKYSVHCDAIN